MTTYLIPTQPQSQQFTIQLDGVTYSMIMVWRADTWYLDISDAQNNAIVQGLPLVTGADLLAQLEYLGLGGELQVASSGNSPDMMPTFAGMGTIANMYWTA